MKKAFVPDKSQFLTIKQAIYFIESLTCSISYCTLNQLIINQNKKVIVTN
jgi:hypothetical protein